jgi:hypothetical protein
MAQVSVSEYEWELRERLVDAARDLYNLLAETPLTEAEEAAWEQLGDILRLIEEEREHRRDALSGFIGSD